MKAVLSGARGVRRIWKFGLLLWLLTLGFAGLLAIPTAAVMHADLGNSLLAGRMLGNFDLSWTAEFLFRTGEWPRTAMAALLAVAVPGYLLIMVFLNGGVLAVLTDAGSFWTGCATHFWRLLRLTLLVMACCALILAGSHALGSLGQRIWGSGMVERPLVIYNLGRTAMALLFLWFVSMVFDYAKIRAVSQDVSNPFRALLGALRFVFRNPSLTIGTYLLVSVVAVILTSVYWSLSTALPRTAMGWLVLTAAVQQTFTAVRVGVRLLFYASASACAGSPG